MSEYVKQNTEATEQYLSFIARTQEQILDNIKKTPVFAAPVGGSFPAAAEVPGFAFPAVSPRELTEASLAFTEKLIGQQKSFLKQYFDITESKISEVASEAKKKA